MQGRSYAGNFVIADIRARIDRPTERLCFFDPDWNPGNNVLVHRQPDDLWRIDYRLPDDETAEQALEPERAPEPAPVAPPKRASVAPQPPRAAAAAAAAASATSWESVSGYAKTSGAASKWRAPIGAAPFKWAAGGAAAGGG